MKITKASNLVVLSLLISSVSFAVGEKHQSSKQAAEGLRETSSIIESNVRLKSRKSRRKRIPTDRLAVEVSSDLSSSGEVTAFDTTGDQVTFGLRKEVGLGVSYNRIRAWNFGFNFGASVARYEAIVTNRTGFVLNGDERINITNFKMMGAVNYTVGKYFYTYLGQGVGYFTDVPNERVFTNIGLGVGFIAGVGADITRDFGIKLGYTDLRYQLESNQNVPFSAPNREVVLSTEAVDLSVVYRF